MAKLRFLHIPKTAGSTFANILLRQYHKKTYFEFSGNAKRDAQRFHLISDDYKKNIELFIGHAPITTDIPEADDIPIITFLRDPISRVGSFCQHVSEGKSPYLLNEFPPRSFDLDDFLRSGNEELSNLQTKMLINQGSCASSSLIDEMSPSEARNKALKSLFERILCFGLQDHFDESLMIFKDKLGWNQPFYISINKKRPYKLLKFREDHIEQIMELNRIDIEVYKAAKNRFLKIVSSEEFDKAKLRKFKMLQKLAYPQLIIERLRRRPAQPVLSISKHH